MAQLKAMGLTIERFYDPELGIVIGACRGGDCCVCVSCACRVCLQSP
jgi:hypothetical protein